MEEEHGLDGGLPFLLFFQDFTLIHSDIWGPSQVQSITNKRWFITVNDNHTHVYWVYLLKENFEVDQIFKNFYSMIQNQCNASIQVFCTNNGKEYFQSIIRDFLGKKRDYTAKFLLSNPKQNGISERKNGHLLEVTHSLIFTMNVS